MKTASTLRSTFALLFLMLLLATSGCRAIEHKILFNPDPYPQNWNEPTAEELAGIHLEDVHFESQDGTRLHGWFVQPSDTKPRLLILFAHGRSGNVSSLKSRLFAFVRCYQVGVFVFDYRGFGKSEGHPTEAGLYEDMLAARDWLAARNGISATEIIVMGRSLGAAVAVDAASKGGAKALIVENGFTSTSDVIRHHSKGLLNSRILHLQTCFDSAHKIERFEGPVFISHGRHDRAFPIRQAKRLAESATGATSVEFVELEGGHTTPPSESYHAILGNFLRQLR